MESDRFSSNQNQSQEIRQVEGVVLDDHNQVVWDPISEQSNARSSSRATMGRGAFQVLAAKPFLLKAGLALMLLPVLAVFALVALVFVIVAFFLGKPFKVYRTGMRSWKSRPESFRG